MKQSRLIDIVTISEIAINETTEDFSIRIFYFFLEIPRKNMEVDLREIFAIFGVIGGIIFLLSITPALILYSQGNYTGATDIVTNVAVDEIVSSVQWAIAIAFITSILAILGIKLKT